MKRSCLTILILSVTFTGTSMAQNHLADGTCLDWAEYALRNFQSQGVYHADNGKLSLIKSVVSVPAEESSIFDGLE